MVFGSYEESSVQQCGASNDILEIFAFGERTHRNRVSSHKLNGFSKSELCPDLAELESVLE